MEADAGAARAEPDGCRGGGRSLAFHRPPKEESEEGDSSTASLESISYATQNQPFVRIPTFRIPLWGTVNFLLLALTALAQGQTASQSPTLDQRLTPFSK